MACIDSGSCGAFSMRHNDSVCTLYAGSTCTGNQLKSDRLYPSDLYRKMTRAVSHTGAYPGSSGEPEDGDMSRPWTGRLIRDAEPIIFGIMALAFVVLLGRTLAPVKGRSISDSVDAWYAARQDMRPQAQAHRTDAGPARQREASPRVVQQGRGAAAGAAPAGPPPARQAPPPPRPPTFVFGHGGGEAAEEATGGASGGGGGGGGAAETLENPLAADRL